MEQVVGEYDTLAAAEHAVRGAERRGMSIQNVYIVDEHTRIWRDLHAPWQKRPSMRARFASFVHDTMDALGGVLPTRPRTEPFAVVMRGSAEQINAMEQMLAH